MMNDIEQYLYSMTPYLIGACIVSIFLNLLLWYELIASRMKCREQQHELLENREYVRAYDEVMSALQASIDKEDSYSRDCSTSESDRPPLYGFIVKKDNHHGK